jgi:soluble lytic murein transglycosylase-like protein
VTFLRPALIAALMASTTPLAAATDAPSDVAATWIASTRGPTSAPLPVSAPVAAAVPAASVPTAPMASMASMGTTPVAAAPVIYKTAAVTSDRDIDFSQGGSPHVLDDAQRANYRSIFSALRAGRPSEAAATLAAMPVGVLHPLVQAELILAKGTPRAEVATLIGWLAANPELPEAERIATLARNRGAVELPALPVERDLRRLAGASRRKGAPTTVGDAAAAAMASSAQKLIVAGKPADAEALLATKTSELSVDGQVEWQERIAWGYYITGDDGNALRLASVARKGMGPWAVQGDWVAGLAAWRRGDCATANDAFSSVARRGRDNEMIAAGHFWAARAAVACGRPQLVEPALRNAARFGETFYGILASRALGLAPPMRAMQANFAQSDWALLSRRSNVRVAAALVEVGETSLADRVLRHQAAIGEASDHGALLRLASQLGLPATQFWLAHNAPAGATLDVYARYPAPRWTPARGWRIDKALIFAHALQESGFSTDAVSRAGARGVMQLMPATAQRMQARIGVASNDLADPAFNIECGQSYLEELRDQPTTGGLLPKVIAAYNAGPMSLPKWNMGPRANADPLLYIESIPYAETRAYVVLVLRNYWMYQREAGEPSASLTALAQGLWPKFPGMPGTTAIRIQHAGLTRAD